MKEQIKNKIRRFLRVIAQEPNGRFYGDVLAEYVRENYDREPDTILRYLREMRDEGEIDYEIVNQSESMYNLTKVS